jgi:hypothetical protein
MTVPRPRRLAGALTVTMLAVTLGAGALSASAADIDDLAERRLERAVPTDKVQLVHVYAATRSARNRLVALGLDVTEHGDDTGLSVVLHGAEDAAILREAGFRWRVDVADLAAKSRRDAAADRRYDAGTVRSPLPSGRTTYRDLADYEREMRVLARKHPDRTRLLTLDRRSVEGRPIRGIEITTNADRVADGKPVMLMIGAHHAREWPSAEHSLEWAYELLEGDDRHLTRPLVRDVRTIVVPVLNVDGFVVSREADALGDFTVFDYEMKRKNCSVSTATPPQYTTGTCADNPAGRLRGTDLNRNYPGFWGGPGASANWSSDTYRGDSPASEPETQALRALISERQVTGLITNHTFSNLVLRPPSLLSTGYSPDEPAYKALGARMTQHNRYANQASFQLYDTSGGLEDWSYWNTGGLGFTFEISPSGFHDPYENAVVAEYVGLAPAAGAGQGGNRAAYFQMARAVRDRSLHSVITGHAPRRTTLKIEKSFTSETAPVINDTGGVDEPLTYTDELESWLRPRDGRFAWHVNPSTRPVLVGRWGREPLAPTQPREDLANPPGIPEEEQSETISFTVGGLPEYDNFTAELHLAWADPDVDWDVVVYDAEGDFVAAAESLANPEVARLIEPAAGEYTAEIINYSGGATSDYTAWLEFTPPPTEVVTGVKESWKFSCLDHRGRTLAEREVVVDRGQRVDIGRACRAAKR